MCFVAFVEIVGLLRLVTSRPDIQRMASIIRRRLLMMCGRQQGVDVVTMPMMAVRIT